MKNIKYILLFLSLAVFTISCDLEEEPILLDATLYNTTAGAEAALDGVYESATGYSASVRRIFITFGYSGFAVTNRGGFNPNNFHNQTLMALKPQLDGYVESHFRATYEVIAQANSIIANTNTFENPTTDDELFFNDIVGQAYLVRSWNYLRLSSLFGDVPVWLEVPNSNNIAKAKSTSKEVHAQAILDAKMASELMNGAKGTGYPKQYAANMLLAKLYMALATNSSLQAEGLSEMDYWQMAYDEAIKVYGQYQLIPNYGDLFSNVVENTSESIWELQVSVVAGNSQLARDFSPWRWKSTLAFAHLKVNADVIDEHIAKYPNDPRIDGTYEIEYERADNGNLVQWYPARTAARGSFFWSFPFLGKYAEKDRSSTSAFTDQNIIIMRYGELLLMLAEISNELQNGEQLGYVTEVLDRVGMTPLPAYSGSKEEFRDAIMNEYRFEVLAEGNDSFHNRRRGFAYFKKHVIDKHNNYALFNPSCDLELSTDESEVMILPFPQGEINFNDLIDE